MVARSDNTAAIRTEAGDFAGAQMPATSTRIGIVAVGEGRGVWASSVSSVGASGFSRTNYGLYGLSTEYRGIWGGTNRADNNYGLFTFDNLYSLNQSIAGAVMQVMRNGGEEAIEAGDVVVFSGIAEALEPGGPPVLLVSRSQTAGGSAVAGVAYSRLNIDALNLDPETQDPDVRASDLELTPEGAVASGEHLLVVVRGPVQVKASAWQGALEVGGLLGSDADPGHAGRAPTVRIGGIDMAAPGTVLGKALEPLSAGDRGSIYIYVTL